MRFSIATTLVRMLVPGLALMLLAGCTTPPVQHDGANAARWFHTAAEYDANSRVVFKAATNRLGWLKANPDVTADLEQAAAYGCSAGKSCPALASANLKPAIVLDVDETVLKNSLYQYRLVLNNAEFDPVTWDAWLAERIATAVPGAVEFINAAKAEGFTIVYLTNRRCAARPGSEDPCPQRADTEANFAATGFSFDVREDLLVMRNERPEWDISEKQDRRQYIAKSHRIAMLVGDDIGDFASDIKRGNVSQRAAFIAKHQRLLGDYWIALTNPTYGSWASADRN